MKRCFFCGGEIDAAHGVGRRDLCPHCRGDLHCCVNCSLFDEFAQNKCREPGAEWVSERERNNFCEFFTFRESEGEADPDRVKRESLAKLEALFKKKPT